MCIRDSRRGARFAMILGDDEVMNNVVNLKPMRGAGEQQQCSIEAAIAYLLSLIHI